jgi:hypothetical protein
LTGTVLLQAWIRTSLTLTLTRLLLLLGHEVLPEAEALGVKLVAVVVGFDSLGLWAQPVLVVGVWPPGLSAPTAATIEARSSWPPTRLTGMRSLHACTSTWLALMLTRWSLLEPPGSPTVAARATGADIPTSAAVAAASAKARFFPDMLYLPPV